MCGSAGRALAREFKSLQEEPLEGFRVNLVHENLFKWDVAIFGPPDTLYHGGYFKARMHFPKDYPFSPPNLRFVSEMWHPNVYENGSLCISILHSPGDDPHSGELPSERWNPTRNVRTILLSVISLLNEPNISSPANVAASVMYRRWRDSQGTDKEYEEVVRKLVSSGRKAAIRDGVAIPMTLEEYCVKKPAAPDVDDFYLDEIMDGDDEDDEMSGVDEDPDDSGNEES